MTHAGANYTIHVGDVLSTLPTLATGSVNCCVTSPPYWGLRDYGTATWDGGDPGCDHQPKNDAPNGNRGQPVTHPNRHGLSDCKCGARRIDAQIGLEETPDAFVAKMVAVFREVRRVLADDGTCWINLGDSYNQNQGPGFDTNGDGGDSKKNQATPYLTAGLPPKSLVGIPWRVALALQSDGWILRQDIIWHKPNPMPESIRDRCTKAHEYLFLLVKQPRYFWDRQAMTEKATYAGQRRGGSTNRYEQNAAGFDSKVYDTRNRRSVWTVNPKPYKGAHFATYPPDLIRPCILAGCPVGGVVLDPFSGTATTGDVAAVRPPLRRLRVESGVCRGIVRPARSRGGRLRDPAPVHRSRRPDRFPRVGGSIPMIDWQVAELRSADGRFRITQSQEEYCLLVRDHVAGQSAAISWHPTLEAAKAAAVATLPPDTLKREPCARCNGLGEYDLRIETLGDTVRAVCCDCRPRAKAGRP